MAVYTTIDDAGSYFNPKLWVGSTSSNVITGVGFQPDWLWIKDRDSTANSVLTDAVRGTDSQLYSNSTSAEGTLSTVVTSFDSDGFTISPSYPTDGNDFVTWCWKAGTTTGIAGSPSITPNSYSFNATSGFSIIEYTGTGVAATLPHGLGVAPKMIIAKKTSGADGWGVYHAGMDATPEDYYMFLDTNAAKADSTMWNDTAPTSTLFSIGTGGDINGSSAVFIAYCFAEIQGFSKFGTYTGNGNADGPFIYTGFRPALLIIKRTDGTGGWRMYDINRLGYNVSNYQLAANVNSVAQTDVVLDIVSNGFKLRTSSASNDNGSGQAIIYAAFADAPLVNSSGVPVNAR